MIVNFSDYYTPKPKQIEAHKNRTKYLLFIGGYGSGKSYYLVSEAIKNALKFSGNRLVIVRKELSVIKRTILVTFFSICPNEIIKNYNQSNLSIEFINGSKLMFIEANVSKDPNLNKIKGLEIGWFGIDEANEVSDTVYKTLKTRLRWILPNGLKPRYEGRLTSNPENCWLIPTFIQSNSLSETYIQASTLDNYEENSEYVITLKETFKDSPQLLKRYLYGDLTMIDSINQLISSELIEACFNPIVNNNSYSIGVDVARYGNDQTVFLILKKGNIEKIEHYSYTSIVEVANKTINLINEYKISSEFVGIDAIGIGAGVVDILYSKGYKVCSIVGGEKPINLGYDTNFRFFNLRSQMYYLLKEAISNKEIGNITDLKLKTELQSIRYEIISEKTLKILSKEQIKLTLGYSPDYADALCYANWCKVRPTNNHISLPMSGG